ncbi:MAG: DUF5309 domain-containing protein, partial [Nanoarchaeota archaeon]|nr:DUF5309 domain-containing protein [Nanoarchaeota archaeon]
MICYIYMALATNVGVPSFDRTTNTFIIDLSRELAEVIRPDNTAFLDRIGTAGFTATQRVHYFAEDSLNVMTDVLNNSGNVGAADATITVTNYARFKCGTIFKFSEKGKTEMLQVNTTPSSTTIAVTRGFGSTSGETHTDGATIQIIAHPKQEGWKPAQEDETKERTSVYNYTQIFGKSICLARTRQLVEQTVIANELAHQSSYRLKEISREMNANLIHGIRSDAAPSATVYGTMGGLIEFASQSGGNTNTTTENLTENVVNTMFKQIWDDTGGVERGFILVGGALKRVISTFDQAYRRSDFNIRIAGFTVEKILTDLGFELEVIVDPVMPDDVMIMGDMSKIKMGPLQGDNMSMEELAKTGRTLEYMISGQYTAEFRN